MIKIFADYVMAKNKRVDITLKYDHKNVLLVLTKKKKLSSGPCNFLYGEKWIGQVNICKPSPKSCVNFCQPKYCSCIIGYKQSHQIHSPRSIQLLDRPNSQANGNVISITTLYLYNL